MTSILEKVYFLRIFMSKLTKEVDALIKLGKSKKEIEETLVPNFQLLSISNVLKSYPEPVEFLKYKKLNTILLICLWIITALNVFFAILTGMNI